MNTPRILVALAIVLSLTACIGGGSGGGLDDVNIGDMVGGGGIGDTIGGDEHSGEPVKGRYALSGTWDLSAPISADRTLGDALADLIVQKLADPIPSSTAAEKLDAQLRGPIKSLVDQNAPEALRPDSALMLALAQTLASIDVVSELELEDGGLTDDLRGTERIIAFGFERDGQNFQVTPEDYLDGLTTIEADWRAQAASDGRTIEVDRHPFDIQFGRLVVWLLDNALDDLVDPALHSDAIAALSCETLVTELLDGRDGLTIEIAGDTHGFSRATLDDTCATALDTLADQALGIFSLGTKVDVGGTVRFLDEDGDGAAETLMSRDDYGGILTLGPEFLAPRLTVQFEGTRQ